MESIHAPIIAAAIKLNHITNLNTYVVDENEKFTFQQKEISIPNFMPGSDGEDVLYLARKISYETNKLFIYINEWGLHYLGISFSKNDTYTVIIGPYLDTTLNLYSLSREYNLTNHESEDLRVVYDQFHILTVDKVLSFSSVLKQFEILLEEDQIPETITSDKQIGRDKNSDNKMNAEEDTEIIKMRYKIEEDFIHTVETGDKKAAKKLFNSNPILLSFSERFPNQPLRRVKNLAIVLNTLLRTAARKRDVPPILIHRISEKYAYEIELTNQIAQLHQLNDDMIDDYVNVIQSNALNQYSKVTQKVIEHLVSFFDKQIDKNELAELTFTNLSHLARKFKKETSMTITGYQQMLRINKAKYLLKSETISIEEIAWIVGYDDSSYFTRVFKKETGYTPSYYRENA
ncbi:helix-turn-helix domain-containing protein [Oceanobacillus sp. CF4.6]|uniref:helix-turn-helix domain-containing protein n=1 Tax=Oceanobacillus sp. CF4.6 TaxID=3373080 RepID=UPI003EE6C590